MVEERKKKKGGIDMREAGLFFNTKIPFKFWLKKFKPVRELTNGSLIFPTKL